MTNELIGLARADIIAMRAYSSARTEGTQGNIWLNANENPWNDTNYNRYPEPQPQTVTTTLSAWYGVDPSQILVTRGSDEGIDLITRLFCQAGQDTIMICPPTYGMYSVAATIQAAGIMEVPLQKINNFALDVNAVLKNWQATIKLIFLCSPNNPTGNLLATADILSLCRQLYGKCMIIVDEAYIEFSAVDSLVKYLNEYPNLIILRTLSKAYGLAGIRCGATLAHPAIISLLKKIIAPYPIAQPVIDIIEKQLQLEKISAQINIIREEREKLYRFLKNLSFVKKIWQSKANFLLMEVDNCKKLMAYCLQQGIVLRERSHDYQLENCIRITIGTPTENQLLMEVLNRA